MNNEQLKTLRENMISLGYSVLPSDVIRLIDEVTRLREHVDHLNDQIEHLRALFDAPTVKASIS